MPLSSIFMLYGTYNTAYSVQSDLKLTMSAPRKASKDLTNTSRVSSVCQLNSCFCQ